MYHPVWSRTVTKVLLVTLSVLEETVPLNLVTLTVINNNNNIIFLVMHIFVKLCRIIENYL